MNPEGGPSSADLIARCRAALAESDETAKAATPGPWRHEWSDMCRNVIEADDDEAAVACTWAPMSLPEDDYTRETNNAAHIAANDPSTRLALNRALTVVLDGIAATLDEHGRWMTCPELERATASLAAIAEALGVKEGHRERIEAAIERGEAEAAAGGLTSLDEVLSEPEADR